MQALALTSRQKAAVIVRLLLADDEILSLERISPAAQAALAHEMARMGIVDTSTRDQVVAEFCDSLEQVGLTFPEGLAGVLDSLSGALSQDITDRLRRMAAMAGDADPWERISTMPAKQLCELAKSEAVEISAVMFSRLPVTKASEAFAMMPQDQARKIAYAMSLTGGIEEAALKRIGMALLYAAERLARPALDGGPVEKVGAILNHTPAGKRDAVLDGLEADDVDFACAVRKSIFTWANIPQRIDPRDIPRILREVDSQVLTRAIAGAKDKNRPTAEFILSGLATRMAETVREEADAMKRLTSDEAEEAMAEIVSTIRRMENSGDLFLIAGEEENASNGEIPMATAEG